MNSEVAGVAVSQPADVPFSMSPLTFLLHRGLGAVSIHCPIRGNMLTDQLIGFHYVGSSSHTIKQCLYPEPTLEWFPQALS